MGDLCGSFQGGRGGQLLDPHSRLCADGVGLVRSKRTKRGIIARPLTMFACSVGRSHGAVSPVVALVIVAAGAVALTVILTAWMASAATHYTQFEAVRSRGCWSSRQGGEILMISRLENVGTTPVLIVNVMINGKPFGSMGSDVSVLVGSSSFESALDPKDPSNYAEILPGETAYLKITMPESSVSNGQELTIGIMTSKGLGYEELVAVD